MPAPAQTSLTVETKHGQGRKLTAALAAVVLIGTPLLGVGAAHADEGTPVAPTGNVYVSDLTPTSVTNPHGIIGVNTAAKNSETDPDRPVVMTAFSLTPDIATGTSAYQYGLGVHTESSLSYYAGGQCTNFSSEIGLVHNSPGAAVFSVIGDGRLLATSEPVRDGQPSDLTVDVADITHLELNVAPAEGSTEVSSALWADAQLACSPPTTDAAVTAQSVEALLTAYEAEFSPRDLESIMADGTGGFTIRAAEPTLQRFAAKYSNVEALDSAGPATALSSTDVVGGDGYQVETAAGLARCSVGFNGFNAVGEAAIITAGHCTDDGRAPSATIADSGEHLGTFGFSQLGGPGNTTDWAAAGTDVAVLDGINPTFNQPAQVTGVGEAFAGIPICKDGAETGHTCGTVEGEGVFVVAGSDGGIRMVQGFYSTDLIASAGDSGGPIMAGTTAVGMISAGGSGVTYGVSLSDAMAHTDDYTVKLALNAPQLTTTEPVLRSADVTGTVAGAPEGTAVRVTIDDKPIETTVDEEGNWSVKAPNALGTWEVTAQAKNGFSTSEIATGSVVVIDSPVVEEPATDDDGTVDLGDGKPDAQDPIAPLPPEPALDGDHEFVPVPVGAPEEPVVEKVVEPKPFEEPEVKPVVEEPQVEPVGEPVVEPKPEVIKPVAEEPAVIVTAEEPPIPAITGARSAGAAGFAAGLVALGGGLLAGVRRLRRV